MIVREGGIDGVQAGVGGREIRTMTVRSVLRENSVYGLLVSSEAPSFASDRNPRFRSHRGQLQGPVVLASWIAETPISLYRA